MENIPAHIAIIPDGNRRWAKERGLPAYEGHRKGAHAMEKTLKSAFDLGVQSVTLWGTSVSNITKRTGEEVKFLFDIFAEYFAKLAKNAELKGNGVRVRILGRWEELFPDATKKPMREAMERTQEHTKRNLTFLMAYDGREEMLAAVKNIADEKRGGSEREITGKILKESLWTRDLPPVDLVIRTGGEPHWSAGFMMWDIAEARLYFTETLWPDFSEEELKRVVAHFARTARRFGE